MVTAGAALEDQMPPVAVLGAPARCLLEEYLEAALSRVESSADVRRVVARAYSNEEDLLEEVLGELGGSSLFGAQRVWVLFEGYDLLKKKPMQAWVRRPPPRTHLWFALVRDPRGGLPAPIKDLDVWRHYEKGPGNTGDLRRWLVQRARQRGAQIEDSALRLLCEHAGESLDTLDSELDKLALYADGAAIKAEHVEQLVGHTAGRDFDELWSALKSGRADRCLTVLSQAASEGLLMFRGGRVYGAGPTAQALLPLLLSRIRRVAVAAAPDEKLRGAAADALAMSDAYLRFLRRDARDLGDRKLGRWLSVALAAEAGMRVSGSLPADALLESLVLQLTET